MSTYPDNRPEHAAQRALQTVVGHSPRTGQLAQLKRMFDSAPRQVIQGERNGLMQRAPAPGSTAASPLKEPRTVADGTGMAEALKGGIENLSGLAMDDVLAAPAPATNRLVQLYPWKTRNAAKKWVAENQQHFADKMQKGAAEEGQEPEHWTAGTIFSELNNRFADEARLRAFLAGTSFRQYRLVSHADTTSLVGGDLAKAGEMLNLAGGENLDAIAGFLDMVDPNGVDALLDVHFPNGYLKHLQFVHQRSYQAEDTDLAKTKGSDLAFFFSRSYAMNLGGRVAGCHIHVHYKWQANASGTYASAMVTSCHVQYEATRNNGKEWKGMLPEKVKVASLRDGAPGEQSLRGKAALRMKHLDNDPAKIRWE